MNIANRPKTVHHQDIDRSFEWVINAPVPYDDHTITEDGGFYLPQIEDDTLRDKIEQILPSKETMIAIAELGLIGIGYLITYSWDLVKIVGAGCWFLLLSMLDYAVYLFTPKPTRVDRYREPKKREKPVNQQYIFNNCEHVHIHNHFN